MLKTILLGIFCMLTVSTSTQAGVLFLEPWPMNCPEGEKEVYVSYEISSKAKLAITVNDNSRIARSPVCLKKGNMSPQRIMQLEKHIREKLDVPGITVLSIIQLQE